MESNLGRLKEDLKRLIDKAELLYLSLANEFGYLDSKTKKILGEVELPNFKLEYEGWYSESLLLIKQILPERLTDFTILYKNEKRKETDFLTYTVSDYLIGLQVTRGYEIKVDGKAAFPKFEQQRNILRSVQRRFESSLFDLRQILQSDIFDNELDSANELLKNGFIRAAGAISGVVLEKHLKEVCSNRSLKITKKNPSINDYNELLKNNNVIEVPQWRFIQHLGDIRNLCDHSKDREPTKDEVLDLISGVRKIIKSVY